MLKMIVVVEYNWENKLKCDDQCIKCTIFRYSTQVSTVLSSFMLVKLFLLMELNRETSQNVIYTDIKFNVFNLIGTILKYLTC